MGHWLAADLSVPRWGLIAVGLVIAGCFFLLSVLQRRDDAGIVTPVMPPFPGSLDLIAGQSGGSVTEGNAIEVIQDGAFFNSLVADIDASQRHVHFETFIWDQGEVVTRVGNALSEAARRGVRVRLLIDSAGSSGADDDQLDGMREAGVKVQEYRPLSTHLHTANYRDHRKIAVIDGAIAYAMGHGVAPEWTGTGQDAEHWRDTALRIRGPAVLALQSVFLENWIEMAHEIVDDATTLAPQPVAGPARIHVAASSSADAASHVGLLHEMAIAAARTEVLISTPYFAPDDDFVKVIEDTARRGVRVSLIVPGEITDSRTVQHAGHHLYARMLEAGVRIFERRTTFPHQKILVVDRIWAHVGSTNLDMRSLEMSEEISVGVLDGEVAGALAAAWERDMADSDEIQREQWSDTGMFHRAWDAVCSSLREQL